MMANLVPPSSVMLLTRKAPGGTSPWSVPPDATFPVGFQLIGQNGLRVAASTLKEDLFLSAIGAASGAGLFLASTGAGAGDACSVGLLLSATGAAFCSAADSNAAAKIDMPRRVRTFFIVFQSQWSRRLQPVEIAAARAKRECSV